MLGKRCSIWVRSSFRFIFWVGLSWTSGVFTRVLMERWDVVLVVGVPVGILGGNPFFIMGVGDFVRGNKQVGPL